MPLTMWRERNPKPKGMPSAQWEHDTWKAWRVHQLSEARIFLEGGEPGIACMILIDVMDADQEYLS